MSARADLAAFLEAALPPTYRVSAAPTGASPEPGFDLCVVGTDEVNPGQVMAGSRGYTLTVIVVGKLATPGPADDHLEALIEEVLDALDGLPWGQWTKAARGTYLETHPAFVVTVLKEL